MKLSNTEYQFILESLSIMWSRGVTFDTPTNRVCRMLEEIQRSRS